MSDEERQDGEGAEKTATDAEETAEGTQEPTEAEAPTPDNAEEAAAEDSDDASGADEAPTAAAPASSSTKGGKKAKKKGPTAAQRLAAERAAKAAKKAAKKAERKAAEDAANAVDDEAAAEAEAEQIRREQERAAAVVNNEKKILYATVAIIAIAMAAVAGRSIMEGQVAEAGGALWEGVETAVARVDPSETPEPSDDGETIYPSLEARAEAAEGALETAATEHSGSVAGRYASLALGQGRLVRGETGPAREAFEAAVEGGDAPDAVKALALEGLAEAFLVEEDWDGATRAAEELATVGSVHTPMSLYLRARALQGQGERDDALSRLQEAKEAMGAEDAPRSPFLENQVNQRILLLDPTADVGGSLGGGLNNIDPALLQQLLRQQQAGQ